METTVARIEEGFSNTCRFPYALAWFACGHCREAVLRDTVGECTNCGATLTHPHGGQFPACACGRRSVTYTSYPRPHNEADRLTKVGDTVDCAGCDRDVESIAWLRSLPKGAVHHARYDPRFSPGSYRLYRHDVASPSGFFLMGSVPATPQFDAVLREVGISPISPTEAA
jgi:hypothetical protein